MSRDKYGRFASKRLPIIALLVALTLGIVAVALGTKPVEWVESSYTATSTVTASVPVTKDNIDKLTEHLENSLRDLNDARATLDRAKQALMDADALHSDALDEFNSAAEYVNTYAQGL